MLPAVVIHGGATKFPEDRHGAIMEALRLAARMSFCVLERGGSALDAAESAIWTLEDTSLFTAGRGANPNSDGVVELDAMIMDGNRLQSGAVMAVRNVWHPISLARYVLERTSNMQFVADGAEKLYRRMVSEGYRKEDRPGSTSNLSLSVGCDTVGCVIADKNGRLVGASSTSGWSGKLPGRVGDSPIIGSGVYANEIAAASCTGRGEQILRIVMARMAVYHVESGMSVTDSAARMMRELRDKTTGEAGLIMVDRSGQVAMGHDTPHMPVAVIQGRPDRLYTSMSPKWPTGPA
ncbi:MAG: isoaspartyl peptidase/L-asparaginase [Candidatus Thorarchaeota archaeon]|nr:isoaspartyl peptidase/L-asparaginase [Candidatus Thorarchaeota archaeon]